MRIDAISVSRFSIPLLEPFTISRASVSSTRAVLVRAVVAGSEGLGEAALPLGAPEEPGDLSAAIERAAAALRGRDVEGIDDVAIAVDACFDGPAPARAGLHCAILDAFARARGEPLHRLLGASAPPALTTDITLPIAEPSHQAELAARYRARGFSIFKIKVGADLEADRRTVRAVAGATSDATVRFDANEGYAPHEALALLDETRAAGLRVDCMEQPCPRADLDGLGAVRREGGVPVVADESIRAAGDLERLTEVVDGVNLKLVKMGGIDRCLAIGRRARSAGLRIMVGAMVESRVGLTAMAHVAAALGGADWVDLDTAFLLRQNPVRGGLEAEGDALSLATPNASGLGLSVPDT